MQQISTTPITGQQAGTSGLRRKTRDWMVPHFLENYVQSTLNALGDIKGKTFVLGGDGRFFNTDAIQIILRILAANGAAKAIVGQGGLLSTPAASHLIRLHNAQGGFILSASHNPGGIDADFGLKFNMANGGPATQTLSDAIYAQTQTITTYCLQNGPDIALNTVGTAQCGTMQVQIVDPVLDYAKLMESLFDFNAIKSLFQSGFRMCFDAMHAVTGPYATTILEDILGARAGTVINGTPLPDFGGGHPDPNPVWAKDLMAVMTGPDAPDFGAASDGDGDRNMIVGRGAYVTPSDSLAVLAAHATCAPAYRDGLSGVARSMPTSRAVDRVADALGLPVYETPTGWKFFGNLLDAGRVSICGEESAGTGSDHVREKDGLWAVLLWLNILADKQVPVADLMAQHWQTYGRNYYSRHDYEGIDADIATGIMDHLQTRLPDLTGHALGGMIVAQADIFAYDDPVDQTRATNQGVRIMMQCGARIVFRLSGTGTQGATLRIYLEALQTDPALLAMDAQTALAQVITAARDISQLQSRLGRVTPDVVT